MNNSQLVYDRLCSIGVDVHCHYPLYKLCHMRLGGVVDMLAMPSSPQQLIDTMMIVLQHNAPYYILGQCSKVLVPDIVPHGIVVCTRGVAGMSIDTANNSAYVNCGCHTLLVARSLAQHGLSGGEFLYCLPSTIGGAVYMNAGCYNQCMADIVSSVLCMDTNSGQLLTIDANQCMWGKRKSLFTNGGLLIIGVNLLLTKCDKGCIIDSMKCHMATKVASQPLTMPSLGSSHYTLVGTPASALIDTAGLRGYSIGGAHISHKHAGFVINSGSATSYEVMQLLDYTHSVVLDKFGVDMHQEIIHMTMRG